MRVQVTNQISKAGVQSAVTFQDGDIIFCDAGDSISTGLILECFNPQDYPDYSSIWNAVYKLDKIADFGGNDFGFYRRSGLKTYLYTDNYFSYNEEVIINHVPDPDGKRYCEAWISYYPTTDYTPTFVSGNNVLATSDGIGITPIVKPILIQSIALPAATSAYYTFFMSSITYETFRMDNYGIDVPTTFCMWAGPHFVLYEYNDGTGDFELALHVDCGSNVSGGAVKNNANVGLISYGSQAIKKLIKSGGVWSVDSDHPSAGVANGQPFFTYGTGFFRMYNKSMVPKRYEWDTWDVDYDWSIDADWLQYAPAIKWQYPEYNWESISDLSFDHVLLSVGGGPYFRAILSGGPNGYLDYKSPGADGMYVSDLEYGVLIDGNSLMSLPRIGRADGFVVRTHEGQLWGYYYLDGINWEYGRSFSTPNPNSGYIWSKYLVGFTNTEYQTPAGVFYCHGNQEVYRLYDFVAATHKPYASLPYYPLEDDMYLVNNQDGTIKLLQMNVGFYDEVSGAVGVLVFNTTSPITTTTNFDLPAAAAGTSYKFLISHDNITWYKYNYISWVSESDIANGNTYTEFDAGCTAGYTPPGDTYTIYIKVGFTSTDPDTDCYFDYADCKMSITVASTSDKTYLTDDSEIEFTHVSDTETKIKSKLGQDVILSAQICIMAPPYNVDYED
jgi:hypothetical protein